MPEEKHLKSTALCKALSISCIYNIWCSSLFQFFGKKFKAAAMLSVFTVSAAVHEYVLSICFGFFYPVLFCLFMCFGSKFQGEYM